MSDTRPPVAPLPPRWKPNHDPASIVIPGLDTNASVTDQIEQIEQLITIKLQNIDEDFSKIHNVLASRILPSVKRYAIGTMPVREAAKFWTSFYEQAAQIRIPTFDDHSTVNDVDSEREETTAEGDDRSIGNQESQANDSIIDPSMSQQDASFAPSQAAFSSTPATARAASEMDSFASHGSNDPSWATSMQSPLFRLKSEIENFSTEDSGDYTPAPASTSSSMIPPTPDRTDVTILPPSTKGKGKAKEAGPLLRNVLRHNLYNAKQADEFDNKPVSPLKFKAKPKTPVVPKTYNPYLPPDTDPNSWSGIVDLTDSSVTTPHKYRTGKKPASHRKAKTPHESDSDDSFDGLPKGMSPPVLMSPARPPRSSAELGLLKLGQSPTKQAAMRIGEDLVRSVQPVSAYKSRGYYGISDNAVESSMSTVTSPPSLTRYARADTSDSVADSTLESMLRRAGLEPSSNTSGTISTPGRLRGNRFGGHAMFPSDDSQSEDDSLPIPNPLFSSNYMEGQDDLDDLDSDEDSLEMDELNNTAHPSAAFLMASQGRPGADDSFGSSNHSSDSLTDELEGVGGLVPVHPFANVVEDDGYDDDSLDYDDQPQTETLFGVPPAQRQAFEAQKHAQGGLRMLGQNLMDDTIGARIVSGDAGGVDESPTPAWGASGPLKR
ncbi:hypothetical protein FA15DRAFT_667021 [Coprinopsis marcescibilis]|uniref:DASH complex subunit ASK1 n=1 Tax=Coprinopsis marcescibilis TaxID=230819 RepID=A0A5C3L225_COPMA|nr:hypothetical protein FA15DRAFT_667021 [Coprinopsis marcescibilis]